MRIAVRHLAGRLVLLEKFLRVVFRFLNVRLIEGIDAEKSARDCGGEFPCEKDLAEVEGIREDLIDDGMAGIGKFFETANVIRSAQPHGDEQAILAVIANVEQWLARDGQDAFAFLAGALRDELLDPQPERVERPRRDERELVASRLRHRSDHRAELRRRIFFDRGDLRDVRGVIGAIEKRDDVDAAQRRRHHAEIRERGVAAADVGHVDEDLAELVALRVALQLRVGVGDRDEVLAGAIALHRLHAIVKIMMKH